MPYTTIGERISSEDNRRWTFEHPWFTSRSRSFVVGEDRDTLPKWAFPSHMVVTDHAPSIRSRRFIETDVSVALLRFVDDLTPGEVFTILGPHMIAVRR
jgi:hypothetical protein